MKIRFNAKGAQRKALVKAIAGITGADFRYLGVPSLCYEVDYLTIDREGTLIFDDSADTKEIGKILRELRERGFIAEDADGAATAEENSAREQEAAEPETGAAAAATERDSGHEGEAIVPTLDDSIGLTISLPIKGFDETAMRNLHGLIDSKAGLIKKALGIGSLPVETSGERISFPWFTVTPDEADATAYANFISALCRAAKARKRVTAKERPVPNEKYAFRCFLLRLGFIGPEHKETRKALLRSLSGNGAFRDGKRKEATGHEVSRQGEN